MVRATRALPDNADAFKTASEAFDRVLKLLDTESRAAETLAGHQRSCSGDLSVLDLGPEKLDPLGSSGLLGGLFGAESVNPGPGLIA
ncbi:MAG: hypothetical protein ACE1Z9_00260 [Acidimicrobiia bacterium]